MKYIKTVFYFLLTVSILANCSAKSPQVNSSLAAPFFADTAKNNRTDSLYLTLWNIAGDWSNCATNSGGVTIMANVCRTINFKSDGTAIVTYPSQERQVVNWSLSDGLLVVTLTGEKNNATSRILTDSIYETHLSKDSEGFNLALKAKDSDLTYYLVR